MSRPNREKMLQLIVDILYDQLVDVKKELEDGREAISDKRKHKLRYTLRLVSKTLAEVLEVIPDEVSAEDLLRIISRAEKVVSRRYRARVPIARKN